MPRFLKRLKERLIESLLFFSAISSVFITAGIVLVLFFETYEFFKEVSIVEFLTDTQWTPLFAEKHFGILSLFAGTFLTTLIAVAVAVPAGLIIALYMSEYVPDVVRAVIKPALEILAGIPTVVYGYFALLFVTPLLQKVIPGLSGFNALSPGIVMGIMIIPIISSLSEDAIRSVPAGLREASFALGSTKLQTASRVVFPAALSGISAAVILGVSRCVGETMIVAIAAGQQARFSLNPLVPLETVTAFIVQVSLGDTPAGTLEYKTIFAAGMSLFVVTFLFNMLSARLKIRFINKYE